MELVLMDTVLELEEVSDLAEQEWLAAEVLEGEEGSLEELSDLEEIIPELVIRFRIEKNGSNKSLEL